MVLSNCFFFVSESGLGKLFGFKFSERLIFPLTDTAVFNLRHVNLDGEVLVVIDALFVLVGVVDHVLVDVENAAAIYEERVEPEVKRSLLAIIELNAHVIVH